MFAVNHLDQYAGLFAGIGASSLGLALLLVGNGAKRLRLWLGGAVLAALIGGSAIAFRVLQAPSLGIASALLAAVWAVGWLLRSRKATESIAQRLASPSFQTACLLLVGIPVSAAWHQYLVSQEAGELRVADRRQEPTKRDKQGEARTDQGTPIALYRRARVEAVEARESESHARMAAALQLIQTGAVDATSNCHGWVFTGGLYWVDCESVPVILRDNGYQLVSDPRPGDLIVYRDHDNVVNHTGVVQAVTSENLVLIESKWGYGSRFIHPSEDQPYSSRWEYYRSVRKGHHLRGLDAPQEYGHDNPSTNSPAA